LKSMDGATSTRRAYFDEKHQTEDFSAL